MKKILTILLSVLMLITMATINVFAERETGLYCTYDFEYATHPDSIMENFGIGIKSNNDIIFLFYDNGTYTNVSNDVSISNEEETGFFLCSKKTARGTNYVAFEGLKQGGKVKISYETYTIENEYFVNYPTFFACDKDDDPKTTIDSIVTEFSLTTGDTKSIKFYLYDYEYDTPIDVSDSVQVTEGDCVEYNPKTNKLTATKQGYCSISYSDFSMFVRVENAKTDITKVQKTHAEIEAMALENSKYRFEYGGNKYILGLGNGSSDEGTMHIDDSSQIKVADEYKQANGTVLIGKANDFDQISEPAATEIYSLFKDFSYKLYGEEFDNISAYTQDRFMFGVNTTDVVINANGRTTGLVLYVEVSFKQDINGDSTWEDAKFLYMMNIRETEQKVQTVSTIGDLQSALGSRQGLINLFGEPVDDCTDLTINLAAGTYNGCINVDLDDVYVDSLKLKGNGTVTINGGIKSNGSLSSIENINFVANDNYKLSYNGSDSKIAILLDDQSQEFSNADIQNVSNCTFTGYDYGIISNGNSLVSGILDSTFKNCKTAIYINSTNNCDYSDSLRDTFDCCDTAIELVKIPRNCTPYQYIFRNMKFFNGDVSSRIDYKIHCDGKFFYTKNYYGKDSTKVNGQGNPNNNEDVRSANIKYVNGSDAKVYSNPCIRYPEDSVQLGIDSTSGLYTGIIYNDGNGTINRKSFDKTLSLDICQQGSGDQLAKVSFVGGE